MYSFLKGKSELSQSIQYAISSKISVFMESSNVKILHKKTADLIDLLILIM